MTLLILIGWCLLVAAHQARQDAQTIAVNAPIFHVAGWVTRAVLCGGTAFALALAEGNFAVTFPLLCGVAYGSFTPAFRWMLNRRRGLDFDYISNSNAYDRLFITHGPSGAEIKMGRSAYAVELTVLAASVLIFLL